MILRSEKRKLSGAEAPSARDPLWSLTDLVKGSRKVSFSARNNVTVLETINYRQLGKACYGC